LASWPAWEHPLDGRQSGWLVKETSAVFEAKFILPWSFSEEAGGGAYGPAQHNMLAAKQKI
jgi:hypothetical protein